MNRANGIAKLFDSAVCYRDFLRLVAECASMDQMRVLAYCVMPNHWHFLLWPHEDKQLFRFVHRLTLRHTQRVHSRQGTAGRGHVYQARYKSVAVQSDGHLLTACRYVERNPLRAGLVRDATLWPWSSAATRVRELAPMGSRVDESSLVTLEPMPIALPEDWSRYLSSDDGDAETDRIREQIKSGVPYGTGEWTKTMAVRLGVPLTRNRGGRPRKVQA
jgi:putative transposase